MIGGCSRKGNTFFPRWSRSQLVPHKNRGGKTMVIGNEQGVFSKNTDFLTLDVKAEPKLASALLGRIG